jgi:hypothetical protein
LGLFQEHRTHARHTETLRSAVISILIVASAGLVTLATYDDKVNSADLPAALLLVVFGLLGTMFSLYHTTKILQHKARASEYRRELDTTVFASTGGGGLQDIRDRVKFSNPVVRRMLDPMGVPISLILWCALPLLISVIGMWLARLAVATP